MIASIVSGEPAKNQSDKPGQKQFPISAIVGHFFFPFFLRFACFGIGGVCIAALSASSTLTPYMEIGLRRSGLALRFLGDPSASALKYDLFAFLRFTVGNPM